MVCVVIALVLLIVGFYLCKRKISSDERGLDRLYGNRSAKQRYLDCISQGGACGCREGHCEEEE